ncbi:hypothetical protein [Salinigranum marinum]|uniref:hypothetical protein n=1 Tax=Salinigranum marinum TaxID=1515595 RepID=UPI002989AAF0|nr:hypothetical protein [Salinigranum marinum]
MTRSLLVYDGSNALFRTAAEAATRYSSDVLTVPWQTAEIQAFLDAQFGSRPFAFVLVEGDSVHVGGDTVERLLRRRGISGPVVRFLTRAYPTVAAPFGRAVHGREPADIHGTFPLDDDARAHLDPLRRGYTIPVETA